MVELGGAYPDVVQALQEAKTAGTLASRFEIDALPKAGRTYDRVVDEGPDNQQTDDSDAADHATKPTPAGPVPDLFTNSGDQDNASGGKNAAKDDQDPLDDALSDPNTNTGKGIFARMFGRYK